MSKEWMASRWMHDAAGEVVGPTLSEGNRYWCAREISFEHLCLAAMHSRHHSDEDVDNPPSRVSDETLDRLYELASPTRISLYDRPWFLWLLVLIGCSAICAYILFLWLR